MDACQREMIRRELSKSREYLLEQLAMDGCPEPELARLGQHLDDAIEACVRVRADEDPVNWADIAVEIIHTDWRGRQR